jgi:PPM family protein phosphatase
MLVGVLWVMAAAAWSWSQDQYYVGDRDGTVVIYRGIDTSLPGLELSHAYESTNVTLDRLCDFDAGEVRDGISASSLEDARDKVDNLASKMSDAEADC